MLRRRLKQALLTASILVVALLVALLIRSIFVADWIVLSPGGITRTGWETIYRVDAKGNRQGESWDIAEVSTEGASVSLRYEYGNLAIEWFGSPTMLANGMRRQFVWYDGEQVFGWGSRPERSLKDQVWPPFRVWNRNGLVVTVVGMSTGFTGRGGYTNSPDWTLQLPLPLLILIAGVPLLIWLRGLRRARQLSRRGFEPSSNVALPETQGDSAAP